MQKRDGSAVLIVVTADNYDDAERAVTMLRSTVPKGTKIGLALFGTMAAEQVYYVDRAEKLADRVFYTDGESLTRADAINRVADRARDMDWAALIFVAHDALVDRGWFEGMVSASETETISLSTSTKLPVAAVFGDAKIGIVVPVMDRTTIPSQRLQLSEDDVSSGLEGYAAERLRQLGSHVAVADVPDLTVALLTREFIDDMLTKYDRLMLPELGDYAERDMALYAEAAGYRVAVAEGVFATRWTDVDLGHRSVGSVNDRLAFLQRWNMPGEAGPRVCIAQIALLQRYGDLAIWRNALQRHADIVDDFVVVLATNPGAMFQGHDPREVHKRIPKADAKMLIACQRAKSEDALCAAVTTWVREVTGPGHRAHVYPLKDSGVDPREQAAAHARATGARWILALDTHEMVEDRITRTQMARLMNHPDPTIRAWNLGILTHWDSPRLVREDSPFGDGGTWTGGDHDVLMWRNDGRPVCPGARAPLFAPESIGTAGVRIRRFKYLQADDRAALIREGRAVGADPELLGMIAHEQNMRLSRYAPQNGIGLHMLAYSRESPEDVARWLDTVHGLVDHAVIVWTEDDFDVPPEFAQVCGAYDASIEHHPLADNIAEARNAGMNALHMASVEQQTGLGWALFFDPDEWLLKTDEDLRVLRRMAEASESWGWLMRVANYRADNGTPTISDSVRMSRLDRDGKMRMSGRVHESFDVAVRGMIHAEGIRPNLFYCPFILQHRGMAFDEERMSEKLDHYERLLRMELDEDPNNPTAWVSLGWHYANEGHVDLAVECYTRAANAAPDAYLPHKELGYVALRGAREAFEECLRSLTPAHPFHELCDQLVRILRKHAPPHPVIPRGEARPAMPLPGDQPEER